MSTSETRAARELLAAVQAELAPRDSENRLAPLIAEGSAPRAVLGLLAAEELHIVPADWRGFLQLGARSEHPAACGYFTGLAAAEQEALRRLDILATAAGLGPAERDAHEPLAGAQAYPAYGAWLAVNAEPTEVVVAITANFAAWGGYCAAIAGGMRAHYGFTDDACGFFDLYAAPVPDDPAVAAVAAGLTAGTLDPRRARRYARLFQSYELMFWNTLADRCGEPRNRSDDGG